MVRHRRPPPTTCRRRLCPCPWLPNCSELWTAAWKEIPRWRRRARGEVSEADHPSLHPPCPPLRRITALPIRGSKAVVARKWTALDPRPRQRQRQRQRLQPRPRPGTSPLLHTMVSMPKRQSKAHKAASIAQLPTTAGTPPCATLPTVILRSAGSTSTATTYNQETEVLPPLEALQLFGALLAILEQGPEMAAEDERMVIGWRSPRTPSTAATTAASHNNPNHQ